MSHTPVVVVAVALLLSGAVPGAAQGPLIAVGGGGTTAEILARTLALSGGRDAIVAVLPQASGEENAGEGSAKMWRDAGVRDVRIVDFADRMGARAALHAATLIWIPGGDQNRFMNAIAGTGLDDLIRAQHAAGTAVGGTSAGAAVLSKVMITGDADLQSLTAGSTQTAAGLGLWPDVIVDQHFLRRQRHNRLLSAVLDRPALVGIGIDEGTAAIARGSTIEVVGRSAIVIIDARGARIEPTPRIADHAEGAGSEGRRPIVAGRDLKITIARAGMTVSLR